MLFIRRPDRVFQRADAFDLHLNNVTCAYAAGGARCARVDHIAWFQSDVLGDVTDDPVGAIEHFRSAGLLNDLPIQPCDHLQVVIFQPANGSRAEWAESVGALAPDDREPARSDAAFGYIVSNCDAENLVSGFAHR